MRQESLDKKSLIITGGASGIGEAAVVLAARAGARVTIADINQAAGEALVTRLTAEGHTVQFICVNIGREADVKAMVDAAVSAYGRLDGAFNNAAIVGFTQSGKHEKQLKFAEIPTDAFRHGMDINATGTFLCIRYEIEAMLASGGGSIVNTSSMAGILAIPNAPDYIASKHAVIGLTKAAALDYATQNIRVNAVLPGVIRTQMLQAAIEADPGIEQWAANVHPIKRLGEPHEVAHAALWLLSDAASLITGISLPVDGGYSMV
ncbi:MAG: oxidoreductase [Betaproteobacteria bacterium HGW-Betaproteobacteria-4]|jgi:2,5-dichloro-2,5-cyclohexadiene-1,4-diol dehydrogenase 1|nr:MAG: oxidoreductase [Betaproteobacteria bacterium HGW-Betaproteobacteria-4]